MVDLATLAIKIDSTQVESGVSDLNQLTAAGTKAEGATNNLAGSFNKASDAARNAESGWVRASSEAGRLRMATDAASISAGKAGAALNAVTVSAGAQRAGMQQLSYQIGDVAQQFALGVNPMTIFAQQGGQVVQALGLMKGGATGLVGFLAGPWGAAIMGAATIVGIFGASLLQSGSDAKKAGADWRDATTDADRLIASLKSLSALRKSGLSDQINDAQMRRNALTEQQMTLEIALAKKPKDARGNPMFSYKQLQDLQGIKQELAEVNSLVEIGTKELDRRSASEVKATAATRGHSAAVRGSASAHSYHAAAVSEDERALLSLTKLIEDSIPQIGASIINRGGLDEALARNGIGTLDDDLKGIADAGNAKMALLFTYTDKLVELRDIAGEIDLGSIFGAGGAAIDSMIASLDRLTQAQIVYNETRDAAGSDPAKLAAAEALYSKAKVNGTLAILGASKNLFSQQSGAYKAIMIAEKTLAAIKLFNSIRSIVMGTAETAAVVAQEGTKTAAQTASGASKIFSQLGWWAFPIVAAMIAVMASLGGKGGGSASMPSIPSADDLQKSAGTGSVLGDSTAKSESIGNSLEIMANNSNADLEYSNQMLRSLRMIELNIGKLAGNVAKQIAVSGSLFDTSGARLGETGSGGFLGIGASSTKRSLYDLGVTLQSATVASIIASGIQGSTYQTIEQVKKKSGFFGIGGSTRTTYQTTTGSIDPSISSAIQDVVFSLRQGLIEGADIIGLEGAAAILDAFQINIGKISFKGMTGQEIEDQLNAIFSKVGDDMAGAIMPALKSMQLIGEGLFETFTRVAREYQVVDYALAALGLTFGAVGIGSVAARDRLVQLFGSMGDFTDATASFASHFLTEAERIAPIASAVSDELARLGLSGIRTKDQFKTAVLGLDLTTNAGQDLFASLMAVAPAFAKVADYYTKANKEIVDEFSGYAKSLRKYRDTLYSGDVASGSAYTRARTAFLASAVLAKAGDAVGLGNLEGASSKFLAASRENATSLIAYQRDVAAVANAVDYGITAADTQVQMAQAQLDAINANTAEMARMRTELAALQTQVVFNTNETTRILTRFDGDGITILPSANVADFIRVRSV